MGAQAGTFVDATPRSPCPICGAQKRCWRARDGRTLRCYHSDTWNGLQGRLARDQMGEGWTFVTNQVTQRIEVPYVPPTDAASPQDRYRVYRRLLEGLSLSRIHREALAARGLSDLEIVRRRYRTLELGGRAAIARELCDRFGPTDLAAIPGFYQRDGDHGSYWTLSGMPGLLIPVRDVTGYIVALRVRPDDPGEGGKYRWISSASRGGTSPGAVVHVPLRRPEGQQPGVVRITEGELKADVATYLDPEGVLTISIPGVTIWRDRLEPVLKALGAGRVRIALDSDWRTNPDVARARTEIAGALGSAGYSVDIEDWVGAKGIDDLFAAGRQPAIRRERD